MKGMNYLPIQEAVKTLVSRGHEAWGMGHGDREQGAGGRGRGIDTPGIDNLAFELIPCIKI